MLMLPIKKCWFDMIASGEKLEEYRDDTPYYADRFSVSELLHEPLNVCFRNGYRADSPKIYCTVIPRRRFGAKPEWGGDPDKLCWVLQIIRRADSEAALEGGGG